MKALFFKIMIAIVAVSMGFWLLSPSTSIDNIDKETRIPITVSVMAAVPKTQTTQTKATGIIKTHWNLAIKANVRGKITHSYEEILPGTRVKKGQMLSRVDDIEYRALLARAKADAAAAKLELAKVLNEQSVAKRINHNTSDSDFRLLKPHVAAAKATLQAAADHLAAVQKQLSDTQIRAPFDAIVLNKYITPSQHVTIGDTMYDLASSTTLDVHVSLSNAQWQKIQLNKNTYAEITDHLGNVSQVTVRYIAPVVDEQTRQVSVVLSLVSPYDSNSAFHPEQLVDVRFTGNPISHAIVAPATVLTRDNQVWTVNGNALKRERINLIEETDATVTFKFPEHSHETRNLVLYPLSTMIEGQTVTPKLMPNGNKAAL